MSDERFSLRESELELPSFAETGPAFGGSPIAKRNRASWSAAQRRIDPSPRVEIARTFYRDALRARMRH